MAEELGKIEKPQADTFKGSRKIYVVPLLFTGADAPPDFIEKIERYWLQVSESILAQEAKVGKINRLYHEAVSFGGEEGLKVLQNWNAGSYALVKQKIDDGAVLEATELSSLADECMDWERCLMMGFYSHKVAGTVTSNYREASQKRYKYISGVIAESLAAGEIGLLFMREGQPVQFPEDTDVFTVAPPVLDEIRRWLRERQEHHHHDEDCGCGEGEDCGDQEGCDCGCEENKHTDAA
jgi:hypothetical protein